MRLKKDQIHRISEKVLKNLKDKHLATLKASDTVVFERISKAITDNMLAEDKLENEARALMEKFSAQIASGALNQQELFLKIKKQLAKDKKMVL